jgi:hypothetical protein
LRSGCIPVLMMAHPSGNGDLLQLKLTIKYGM